MVTTLLSSEVAEKLEPLRAILNLNESEFSEGVFSWRGFIYYKWSIGEFWNDLIRTLKELQRLRPIGRTEPEHAAGLTVARRAIVLGAKHSSDEVRNVLAIYDRAYARLVEHQDPGHFREFLLSAPSLFLDMGEKMGAMSHITSFWRYRFPPGAPKVADSEELTAIFQDFCSSLGISPTSIGRIAA